MMMMMGECLDAVVVDRIGREVQHLQPHLIQGLWFRVWGLGFRV